MIKDQVTIFGQKSSRSRHTSGMVLFHLDSDCFVVGLGGQQVCEPTVYAGQKLAF